MKTITAYCLWLSAVLLISMFVHMGGSWGKQRELDVIKSGNIWYKKTDIHDVSVNIIGNTAVQTVTGKRTG